MSNKKYAVWQAGGAMAPGAILLWTAVWLLTRALMVSELGFWRNDGHATGYQDVDLFQSWSTSILATHLLPHTPSWQYPPGAAWIFLLPGLASEHYGVAFVTLMLILDAVTTVLLARLALSGARSDGVWLWLLAIPALGTLPLLRFDMVPTCIAVAALTATSARVRGAIIGFGIMVKAWPVLLLITEGSRSSLRTALATATATCVTVTAISWLLLGNPFGFLGNQGGRGLELEAVAASPWYLLQALLGYKVNWADRYGSLELVGSIPDLVARVLAFAALVLAVALVAWWLKRDRLVRAAHSELVSNGADAAFTVVLWFITISRVLSPQYFVWLIGIGGVALASRACTVRRPVLMVAAATLVTQILLGVWGDLVTGGAGGAYLLVLRNVILLVAALDAGRSMFLQARISTVDTYSTASSGQRRQDRFD